MPRKTRRRRHPNEVELRKPPGSPPGSLVSDPNAPSPVIRAIGYGPDGIREQQLTDLSLIGQFLAAYPVTWVNVDGLGDTAILRKLGEMFNLHMLALEDVNNPHQRAKVEQYPRNLFVVGRMVGLADRLETEQLSLFLGKNYVLTFQERAGDSFDPVRNRIRRGGGRVRSSGPDYLAYALLDALIDNYFPVLEQYGERLEGLEDEVITRPEAGLVAQIHQTKRDLLALRRAIWPLRETVNSLVREPTEFITDETRIYFRDCYDHTIQIIDLLENYRDIASGLMEVYLSSVSNRMNEIMKILTMFTALFIPLSLIAGIYGMNFNSAVSPLNMPELSWYLGYPYALGLMAVVAIGMLMYFRKKKWLGFQSHSVPTNPKD